MGPSENSDQLYNDAACGLLLTEADGTIVRVNRTFCASLGRSQEELLGRRLQSLLSVGGKIFHQTHWAPLLKMQGSLAEVKLELLHADGQKIPMVMNAVVRRQDGIEFHELAVFSARDRNQYERELLLARKRSDEHLTRERESQKQLAEARARLELAIEAAQLFQWSVELPGGDRYYAPEVATLLGHTQAEPIEASAFLERIHPDDMLAERASMDAILGAGRGRFRTTFRLLGVDGVERWVTASGSIRLDATGVPAELVGVLQDVSEAHSQRALAEDRALLAEQTLGIVGHDLRNPLSAIQMGAQVLTIRPLDFEHQRSVAERIQSSTRRANRLIADLLDFTQARTGRGIRLNKGPADGHALSREVVGELSTANPTRKLRHVSSGEGALIVDGDRIVQALGNLISNALTYGLHDAEVLVSSIGLADGVRFEVHNEGPEIAESVRPSLFEPMSRGENPGHLRSVGLGLYIVREIALAHRGHVECLSDAASGTTFIFYAPR